MIGIVVGTPIAYYVAKKKKESFTLTRFAHWQVYSLCFGVAVSLGMMTAKYVSWENKKLCLEDRAYRIHRNAMQNRVDEITIGAFVSSAVIAFVQSRSLLVSLGLTTPGIVAGLIYHALTA